jgi:predicted phosphodiesterase
MVAGDRSDQRFLVDAFLDDVGRMHDAQPVDLAVFTGDLTQAGQAAEFVRAREVLLDPLLARLGLGPDRLVLVPGNHDVDRSRVSHIHELGLQQALTTPAEVTAFLESGEYRDYLDHLDAYEQFVTDYLLPGAMEPVDPLARCGVIEINGVKVGIAALNSAWRATGQRDVEEGALLLGELQIRHALASLGDCDLRIACMHHPLSWLDEDDQQTASKYIYEKADLLLEGHLHSANPHCVTAPLGTTAFSDAGCLYESIEYPNSYSVLDCDLSAGTVTANVRTYWRDRHAFGVAENVAAHGIITLPLGGQQAEGRKLVAVKVSRAQVRTSLVEMVQRTSIIPQHLRRFGAVDLEAFITPPVLLKMPYAQAVATATQDEGVGGLTADPIGVEGLGTVTVVVGEAESGLTTTLLWLLHSAYERDATRIPLYVDLATALRTQRAIDSAVTAAAADAEIPIDVADPPPLLLGIDNVSPGSRRRMFQALARHIQDAGDTKYILGCNEGAATSVVEALKLAGVECNVCYLAPFGRAELRSLVVRLLGPEQVSLTDKILPILHAENLPRTPFFMAAMIFVVDELGTDINATWSETNVLDKYAGILLGREIPDDVRTTFDFRNKEHFLNTLAANLTVEGQEYMAWRAAERYVADYLDDRSLPGRASDVLRLLLDSHVLLEIDEGIAFRHPAFRRLFAGKAALEANEDELRDILFADPLGYGAVLRHSAALDRTSDRLLKVVASAYQEGLGAALEKFDLAWFDRISMSGGWSKAPELDEIVRLARWDGTRVSEEMRDQAWDDMEAKKALDESDPADLSLSESAGAPDEMSRLLDSVFLMSSVLRSSELVQDRALRIELLKESLRGWGLMALITAVGEDQTGDAVNRFISVVENPAASLGPKDREKVKAQADLLALLFITMVVGQAVADALGSQKMVPILREVLGDPAFMDETAPALLGTLLYVQLGEADWPDRLTDLTARHPDHPVIQVTARVTANYYYHHASSMTRATQTKLENLMTEILTRQARLSGKAATAAGETIKAEMRMSRQQHLLAQPETVAQPILSAELTGEPE